MTIANVALTDTFDVWRVRTNQLITLYDETNQLARSSYNATNLAVVTSSNIAANIISGNSAVYNTIYASTNTITLNVLTKIIPTFYDAANASFNISNAAIIQANAARNFANTSNAYVVAYSSNTRNTVNLVFNSMNVEANITRTIANLSYDTANNFVANSSNSVAAVLATNTIIQNIVNTTTNTLVSNYLANVSFSTISTTANLAYSQANTARTVANSAFNAANTANPASAAAYNTANAAYNRANTAGGGYFAGNNGYTGNANNKADIFRVNSNTFTGNIVFAAGENASATGPLYMNTGSKLEIKLGARVVIL